MESLTKTDILFIRACKSNNVDHRINRLYKMLYLQRDPDPIHILMILSSIYEKLPLFRRKGLTDIIQAVQPNNYFYLGCDMNASINEVFKAFIISRLRLMRVDDIQGWITPAGFKKQL